MISFSEDFFKEEVRDGFLISEMMKRCWAVQMSILDVLQDLFERKGLVYYAEVGTLLGVARHKGYVPWDDDIDIAMPREDYMKFLKMENELPEDLCIRSFYNIDSFSSYHAVVAHKADVLKWDEERMKKNYGCPFICFLDIFPLDFMPNDPEKFKIHKQLYYVAYKAAFDCKSIEESVFGGNLISYGRLLEEAGKDKDSGMASSLLEDIKKLQYYIEAITKKQFLLDENRSLRNQLYLITDEIAQMCHKEEAGYIDYSPNLALIGPPVEDKPRKLEWYQNRINMPFEQTFISVPCGYREELANQYGDRYMIPLKYVSEHEYPFYKDEVTVFIGGDTGDTYGQWKEDLKFPDLISSIEEIMEMVRGCTDTINMDEHSEGEEVEVFYDIAMDDLAIMQQQAEEIGTFLKGVLGADNFASEYLNDFSKDIYDIYSLIEKAPVRQLIYDKENKASLKLVKAKNSIFRQMHEGYMDEISSEWKKMVVLPDGSLKKVIIYGISAGSLINAGTVGIKHIREYLNTIGESSRDIIVFMFVPFAIRDFMKKCHLGIYAYYLQLLDEIENMDFVILLENAKRKDIEQATLLASEYYGDLCSLYDICYSCGLAPILQDYQT